MNRSHADILETICQNIPDGICMIDQDWIIRSWNRGAEKLFGYPADEIIGENIAKLIPPDIAQKEIEHCTGELNRSGIMTAYRTLRVARDGRIIPIELTAVAIRNGMVTGYASIMRDISERVRLEEALSESEANMRTIFNSARSAIIIHDLEGRILDVNDRMLELYRIDREAALKCRIEEDLSAPVNVSDRVGPIWSDVLAGKSTTFEWKAKRPGDGSTFDAEVYLRRITLKRSDAILALVLDITDQKRAEHSLRLMQFSIDHASLSVLLVGKDARILYANEQTCRALGFTSEELLGMTVHDIDPHFPAARWAAHWSTLREAGTLRFETEHRKKDGTLIPVDLALNYVSFGGGEYNWAFASDITDRKHAEQVLRESEERYRSIVETSTEWIWEIDVRGHMTFNNRGLETILGYRPGELSGRTYLDIVLEDDREKVASGMRQAIAEKRGWNNWLVRWKHRDGSIRYLESNAVPRHDRNGELLGFRGSDHDITGLKRAEEQLKQAYADLEEKVVDRTRELARTNEELQMEVIERRRAVDLIRRSQELGNALNDLNAVIHSSLDLEEIMRRVVKQAAEVLQVDGSMIGVFEGDIFRVRFIYNLPDTFIERTLTTSQLRAIHHASLAGEPLAFNDAFHDARLNTQFTREMGIRSLLVAPLFLQKKITGALAFYGLSRHIIFDQEHLSFARKLSTSVSLALDNAQLYEALQQSKQLAASRFEELQILYDTAPVGLCFLDREKRYVRINRRLAAINGMSIEDHLGRPIAAMVKDQEAARVIDELCTRVLETGKPIEGVEVLRQKNTGLTVLSHFYPVLDREGRVAGLNIVVQDITERKRAEEAVRGSERLLKAMLNSIPDIAWLKDDQGRFILVNEPFGMASGKRPEQLIGKTDFDAWPPFLAERYVADDRAVMSSRQAKRVEEPLAVRHGPERWIETIKTCILNEQGAVVGTAGVARDITDRKRMEEEIRHMAQHDALTGLPNRRLFVDILNLEMAQAKRHESKLAVLFLDLDRFKEVNDTLGHEAGDRLLKIVATRLRGAIRESDTVARIGGDEFNIVLSDLVRSESASEIARKIVETMSRPISIAGHDLHVTTSVGISIFPDDGIKVDTLLRYADIAMYHAKESGRNTFRFYNPSINVLSLQRMKLAGYLAQTIKRGELTVMYQPQIDIRSRTMFHAEALVRWNHPERGMLGPDEFIPLAHETGFIGEIDDWVLRTVCTQARSWHDTGFNSFCLSVNLSARGFQSADLVARISAVMKETGVCHHCLGLEVTESAVMSHVDRTAAQLQELRRMGISISIDDFGTGYSSLSYLKKLPIDRLKIDKSFIRDIAKDPDDRAIISAVTSMARKMGIRTVAEGVETEEQLSFLRDSECDEAQGFLFSRPVLPERFREVVSAER